MPSVFNRTATDAHNTPDAIAAERARIAAERGVMLSDLPSYISGRVYAYDITCTRCDTRVTQIGDANVFHAATANTFRWHRGSGRYVSRCRSCERVARRDSSRRRVASPRYVASPSSYDAAALAARQREIDERARVARAAASRANVGNDRTFGVEFEVIARGSTRSAITSALSRAGLNDWRVVGDCSLSSGGLEIVSPVLRGDAGMRAVETACRVLRDAGCTVDSSCGTHVHHGAGDLDIAAFHRIARSWANNQHVIDGCVAESRRGSARATYTRSFDDACATQIESAITTRDIWISRYHALNFAAYSSHGTIEIRQHAGTIDYDKIRAWILFGRAIINAASTSSAPMSRHETVRAFLADIATRCAAANARFDTYAQTHMLGRAAMFNVVPVA